MAEQQTKTQGYANALYARMDKEAVDGIWSGRLVETCIDLGIPQGGYNRAVNALRKMGCIEQLVRGFRGSQLSSFVLRQPPTPEVWDTAFVKSRNRDLTKRPSLDTLIAQTRDLEERIGGLNIVKAFKDHEDRITALERLIQNDSKER